MNKHYQPVGNCRACGRTMMSDHAWKAGVRPPGTTYHTGLGLCQRDHSRWLRNGTTEYVGVRKNRPKTLEEVPIYRCETCKREICSRYFRKRFPELEERCITMARRDACATCYEKARENGTFVRVSRSAEEVLEDWEFLRDDGVSVAQAAERMGMKLSTLKRALERARAKGDPRGSLVPFAHDMRRVAA